MPRFVLFLSLVSLLWPAVLSAATAPEVAIWEQTSTYLTKEAIIGLRKLPAPTGAHAQRERDFCTAVVTLDQQPLSESRLDDVEARLQTLLAAQSDDWIAGASNYLLGRIAQIYRETPEMEEAARHYQAALDQPEAGEWAKLARLKLAVLQVYVLPAGTRRERIDAVLTLLDGAKDPVIVRDLHRLVARAVMFFNLPPELALEHLIAAEEIGGLEGTLGADQLVQIGELASDTGQLELSAQYYEKLRREYPRDLRIYLNDQRQAGRLVPQRREELNGR